jgi:hypothetical protein
LKNGNIVLGFSHKAFYGRLNGKKCKVEKNYFSNNLGKTSLVGCRSNFYAKEAAKYDHHR